MTEHALSERTKGDDGGVCVYFHHEDRWLYEGAGQEYADRGGLVSWQCELTAAQLRMFAAVMVEEAERLEKDPVVPEPPATLSEVFTRVARREMTPEEGADHIERIRKEER